MKWNVKKNLEKGYLFQYHSSIMIEAIVSFRGISVVLYFLRLYYVGRLYV